MKTRLMFRCCVIAGTWMTLSCAQVFAAEETNLTSGPRRVTTASKPTSSAATTAQVTEKLKAVHLSPAVKEIVRMSEAGMDSAVIQAYVENSNSSYSPRAEEIIYLHEHGIPNSVITAMIQRAGQVREEAASVQANAAAPAVPAAPDTSPSPQPTVRYVTGPVRPEYPTYAYSSPNVIYVPYSGYNYCYSPNYYSRPYFGFSFSSHVPFGYGRFGHVGFGHYRHGYRHCW